jgi:hypothetical protein
MLYRVKELCIVWLIGSTTRSIKTQLSAKKKHIMKVSIDSINSVSLREEYCALHCRYGDFLGTYIHPVYGNNRDLDIELYRIFDELVFETKSDLIWQPNEDFELLVEKYGINIARVLEEDEEMNTYSYSYATDSSSGTVKAVSLDAAYEMLRAKITDEMIADGATLWIESPAGARITME